MPRRKGPAFLTPLSTSCWPGADPKTAFGPKGLIDDLKKTLLRVNGPAKVLGLRPS